MGRLVDFALGAKLYGPMPVPDALAAAEEAVAKSRDGRAHSMGFSVIAYLKAMQGRFDERRAAPQPRSRSPTTSACASVAERRR